MPNSCTTKTKNDSPINEQLYCLVPLIRRQDLTHQCIQLLNQEWPRSEAARANSMAKAISETPPMSLLLLEKKTGLLIGHARLCRLLDDPDGCWIESVIIDPNSRNRGIGRLLMYLVEKTAFELGFSKAYLSTKDKQAFYTKCGYQVCGPVVHIGATMSPLLKSFSKKSITRSVAVPESSNSKALSEQSKDSLKQCQASSTSPPAPPLPNFLKNSQNGKSFHKVTLQRSQYMYKFLG